MCAECGVLHGNHQPSCTWQNPMSPSEWWALAQQMADAYVVSHQIRPYAFRTRARSIAMKHIIKRARQHPQASELLQLIHDAGWNV